MPLRPVRFTVFVVVPVVVLGLLCSAVIRRALQGAFPAS